MGTCSGSMCSLQKDEAKLINQPISTERHDFILSLPWNFSVYRFIYRRANRAACRKYPRRGTGGLESSLRSQTFGYNLFTPHPKFYIGCAQINVIGGGNGTPGPLISFPGTVRRLAFPIVGTEMNHAGAYSATDPGILISESSSISSTDSGAHAMTRRYLFPSIRVLGLPSTWVIIMGAYFQTVANPHIAGPAVWKNWMRSARRLVATDSL